MEPLTLLSFRRPLRGFTLIEMLVALAIITILTSIVIVEENSFSHTILLTDTAYTVALSVRQVQSLGLSSRQFVQSGTPNTYNNAGYGVHFAAGLPTSYVQFADVMNVPLTISPWCGQVLGTVGQPDAKPGNCLYDNTGENFQTYTLKQGYTISNICGYFNNVLVGCSSTSGNLLSALDIVYIRTNTTAIFTGIMSDNTLRQLDTACVTVRAPDGGSRNVKATVLGEVLVGTACP